MKFPGVFVEKYAMSAIRKIGTTFITPVNRMMLELREKTLLSPGAALSENIVRSRKENGDPYRTAFQVDRDRIFYSPWLPKLKGKAQIYIAPSWPSLNNRYTHSLKVARVSIEIAIALGLNADLVEAIALGHDLGHSPFGHEGEAMLGKLSSTGFKHFRQSLRIVDELAKLNLSWEVRNGILCHSVKTRSEHKLVPHPGTEMDDSNMPGTLEGCVVRLCDKIAYVYHDLQDALFLKIVSQNQIPEYTQKILGPKVRGFYGALINDVIENSKGQSYLSLSPEVGKAMEELRAFNYEKIVQSDEAKGYTNQQVQNAMNILFEYYFKEFEKNEQRTVDYVASLTDMDAIKKAKQLADKLGKKLDLPTPKY